MWLNRPMREGQSVCFPVCSFNGLLLQSTVTIFSCLEMLFHDTPPLCAVSCNIQIHLFGHIADPGDLC